MAAALAVLIVNNFLKTKKIQDAPVRDNLIPLVLRLLRFK